MYAKNNVDVYQCNLNPNSDDYIAKVIGNQEVTYSTSKKKFVANWVGAHVRIQEWKGATPHGNAHFNDCDEELEGTDQHGCKSWITIGNFVIPTAKDPNSQAGRKLKKKVNKNPWERLDQTVAGIPIKLKKWQQQKC